MIKEIVLQNYKIPQNKERKTSCALEHLHILSERRKKNNNHKNDN
jgi:hypothetical protein